MDSSEFSTTSERSAEIEIEIEQDNNVDDDDRLSIPPRNIYQLVRRIKTLEKQRHDLCFQFYDPSIGLIDGEEDRMRSDRLLRNRRKGLRNLVATAPDGVEQNEHGEIVQRPRRRDNHEQHQDQQVHQRENIINGLNLEPGLLGFLRSFILGHHIILENERQREQEEERERDAAVARQIVKDTIRKYRENGVDKSKVLFVQQYSLTSENGQRNDDTIDNWRVTLKRILFAVFGFICVVALALIHSFSLFNIPLSFSPNMENKSWLEADLFRLQDLGKHIRYCSEELDRNSSVGWYDISSCSNGVLHLKSLEDTRSQINKLADNVSGIYSSKADNMKQARKYRKRFQKGFDHTWKIENCKLSQSTSQKDCRRLRGVHDGMIQTSETSEVINMGISLIANGGHHDQIYNDTNVLIDNAYSTFIKLRYLLESRYNFNNIQPVAFRVSSTPAIMPSARIVGKQNQRDLLLAQIINWTAVERNLVSHEKRCILNKDLQYRSDFLVHTQIYLTSMRHFDGGSTFFLDNDDNLHLGVSRQSANGLLIDSEEGRIIVNSGTEWRCSMPVFRGIRAVLQVWWDTS